MTDGQQLLADYVETGSETAFRELVSRYVDFVYSAAVRLVNGDAHLAEDITQAVFVDLARMARTFSREVMLGGWLHRHTCFVAGKTLRGERRRQARERQAVEMNAMEDHSEANLARIAPLLDEAINQLGSEDRAAILLRFFEQNDFQSVGAELGASEEAARKRVDRALDKLHASLTRRGVALSVTVLGTTLATQAVTAAPVGLAASISGAALAGAAAGGGATLTLLQIMSMTKLKVGIVTAVVAAGVTIPWVIQQRTQTRLHEANKALQQQSEKNNQLAEENQRLTKLLASAATPPAYSNSPSLELLRLRGEVGRLRQENASATAALAKTNGPSALSGITANPEMYKVIRDQQKMGLGMVYKDFTNRISLPPEQSEQLVNLLADDVMENIDRITEVLRDKKSPAEMNQVFTEQEAALLEKVKAMLGPEGFAQYQDYTKNLASHLTAEQFKGMMTGEKDAKDEKSRLLYQLMLEETQRELASAGLPPDYQTVPTLNFRNIASEQEGERNLQLLDAIYGRVAASAGSFLSESEVEKFIEFRAKAINGNRMALALNRKLMAPAAE